MSRPTISLAMIVKNEADNLPRLLESVKGCFDEIHITDTGSTDDTVRVAESLGARVHHFEWCDDFSAARNASFKPVTTDYVMWMDGDDVLENKDAFIQFRDYVMGLNDYWLANYHYSSDAEGKPLCTFVRERVLRNDRDFKWKYFVHEGVLPIANGTPIKMDFTPAWAIRHKRTDSDMQKDKSRNLRLFEVNKNKLDARMRYYYGKELFEAQKPMDAIHQFLLALSEYNLEMHDRILGYQHLGFAYMQCNQWEKAIDAAHTGLQLAPNRAEFYTTIGDCYLKLGRLVDAIPAFQAAKNCYFQSPEKQMGAIFHAEDAYTVYPRNQLARIYFNLGDMDRAKNEAEETVSKYNHGESRTILAEVIRLRDSALGFKNAKECDDIVISCPFPGPYQWDPGLAQEKSMGGSETAAIEMAKHLHKVSGRPVKVFNVRETDQVFDGVEYISSVKLAPYMAEFKPFLHIAWRHNIKITDAPTFLWCHDLTTPGAEHHEVYDKILCLTPFHRNYVMTKQAIPDHKIHVTRNGLKPERFKSGPFKKDPFRFVFGSSPDRGMDRAMRVLDKVRERYPQVTLHLHYGVEHLHKYGLQPLADKILAMIAERKDWVTYHGATQQDKLMESYQASAYCVQPSDWIETSMISAMELTCSGVYPIMRRIGGVADTLADAESKGMATLVDSDCITERDYQVYVDATLKALDERAYERVNLDAEKLSWEKVAEEWLRDLPQMTRKEPLGATA